MRKITDVIIHCSATREGHSLDVHDIRKMHLARGWRDVGYHFVVTLSGDIQVGRNVEEIGAHVRGYNAHSVGICYIGGLDKNGEPKDTRTFEQKFAMEAIIAKMVREHPITRIAGHRDYSPDLDGDGIVESHEWLKACPCFNAESEYRIILEKNGIA